MARLVEVFRAVRRVLSDDGTLWLNLGDSYGSGNSGQTKRDNSGGVCGGKVRDTFDHPSSKANPGTAPVAGMFKQLLGIPWRVAFALQADGWYLRSDIIWSKPNPMPESVRDRPTKAHEYIFLLSKQATYYYDADSVREPFSNKTAWTYPTPDKVCRAGGNGQGGDRSSRLRLKPVSTGRNRRSVWTIATRPYKGAHFATFPPKLIEPCILAGSAVGDTVLDPFCGSGTTGAVAIGHGRAFIGIDLKPKYLELTRRRLDAVRAATPLLTGTA